MEKKHRGFMIFIILLCLLMILPAVYVGYDRSLTLPPPNWTSPPFTPDPPGTPKPIWLWFEGGSNYFLNYASTHQPNALNHYINALSLATEGDYFADIMEKGLTQENSKLDKEILLNKPAVDELLQGARMKHCELPSVPFVENPPLLNFIQARIAIDELILAARKLEYQKQYSKAAEYYLCGIQFGKDFCQKDQILTTHMVGLAIIGTNERPLLQLISSGKLEEKDYRTVIKELARMYQELAPISDSYIIDYRYGYMTLAKAMQNPKSFVKEHIWYYPPAPADNVKKIIVGADIIFNRNHALQKYFNYKNEVIDALTTKTYHDFILMDWEKRIPYDPVCKGLIYDPSRSYTRQLLETIELPLAEIQSAINLYYLQKKKYPNSLEELKPDYLTEIPLDPFVDKPFHLSQDSSGTFVYSVGADFKDDGGKIFYDPHTYQHDSGDIRS